jgi:hypothetical protein
MLSRPTIGEPQGQTWVFDLGVSRQIVVLGSSIRETFTAFGDPETFHCHGSSQWFHQSLYFILQAFRTVNFVIFWVFHFIMGYLA